MSQYAENASLGQQAKGALGSVNIDTYPPLLQLRDRLASIDGRLSSTYFDLQARANILFGLSPEEASKATAIPGEPSIVEILLQIENLCSNIEAQLRRF